MKVCPVCESRKLQAYKKSELTTILNGLMGGVIIYKENREKYMEQKRALSGLKKDGVIYLIHRIRKMQGNDVLFNKMIDKITEKRLKDPFSREYKENEKENK